MTHTKAIISLILIVSGTLWAEDNAAIIHMPNKLEDFHFVQGGNFEIGNGHIEKSSAYYHLEESSRIVTVENYCISKLPVTAQEFCLFLNSSYCKDMEVEKLCNYKGFKLNIEPVNYSNIVKNREVFTPVEGGKLFPANTVSWLGAVEYCRWLNTVDPANFYRLPSEAEWEIAARGKDKRVWPWGNSDPKPKHGIIFDLSRRDSIGKIPVGNYPENSTPDNVLDLCGNGISEWCSGKYFGRANSDQMTSTSPFLKDRKSLRPVRGFWTKTSSKNNFFTVGNAQYDARPWSRMGLHPLECIEQNALLGFRVIRLPRSEVAKQNSQWIVSENRE